MKNIFLKIKNYIISHKLISSFIVGFLVLCITAGILLPIFLSENNQKLTRGVWVQMLSTTFRLNTAAKIDVEPYFSDIPVEDVQFNYIQSLKGEGIITYENSFIKSETVTFGEILVQTGKLTDTNYIARRVDNKNELTDADISEYIRNEVKGSDKYKDSKVLTIKQAQEWLSSAQTAFLNRTYKNDVSTQNTQAFTDMSQVVEYNVSTDNSELTLSSDNQIKEGQVLLLGANEEYPFGVSLTVEDVISQNGNEYTLNVRPAEISEAFDYFDLEFSKGAEDISKLEFIAADGVTITDIDKEGNVGLSVDQNLLGGDIQAQPMANTSNLSANTKNLAGVSGSFESKSNWSAKLFDIALSSEKDIGQPLTNDTLFPNAGGNTATGHFLAGGKLRNRYSAGYEIGLAMTLSNFKLTGNAYMSTDILEGLWKESSFNVTASIDVTPEFSVKGVIANNVPIGTVYVPISYGFGVEVVFYLNISLSGEMSVTPTITCSSSVYKNSGNRLIRSSIDSRLNKMSASISADVGISVGPAVTLMWTAVEIVDVYVFVGINTEVSYTTNDPEYLTVDIYLPTVTLGMGRNEDTIVSLLLKLVNKGEFSVELIGGEEALLSASKKTQKFKLQNADTKIEYKVENGVLTVYGTGQMSDYIGEDIGDAKLPPWYTNPNPSKEEDPTVNTYIKKVIIEDGITYIGAGAFASLSGLEEVVIADSVKLIGTGSFDGCEQLKKIKFSKNLESIGSSAFFTCNSITELTLPDNLKEIGEESFSNCEALEKVTIPNSVQVIGVGAFKDCTSLKDITLGNGIKKIKRESFSNCTALEEIVLPANLKRIPMKAFSECSSLKKVTLSPNTKEIGLLAFENCRNLSKVINSENTALFKEEGAFYNCIGLGEYNYGEQNVWEDTYWERVNSGIDS